VDDVDVSKGMVKWVSKLEAESVIDISGVVAVPSEGPVVSCTQKEVELVVHSVYCVSRSAPRLPFEARSIHWFPYDRVGVVNADP
jgi:aspartyl/asparaginyl-tRNA synthetase